MVNFQFQRCIGQNLLGVVPCKFLYLSVTHAQNIEEGDVCPDQPPSMAFIRPHSTLDDPDLPFEMQDEDFWQLSGVSGVVAWQFMEG